MISTSVTANTDHAPGKLVLKEILIFSSYINSPELYTINTHFIDYFIIWFLNFHNVGDEKLDFFFFFSFIRSFVSLYPPRFLISLNIILPKSIYNYIQVILVAVYIFIMNDQSSFL